MVTLSTCTLLHFEKAAVISLYQHMHIIITLT